MTIFSNKIQSLVLFIVNLLTIILLTTIFWNSLIKANANVSAWAIVVLTIALVSNCLFYILYLRETNLEKINEIIDQKVEKERLILLAEFAKEEVVEEIKIDLDEVLGRLIPKGNFKNINSFTNKLLQNLAHEIKMSQGIFYIFEKEQEVFKFSSGYAVNNEERITDFKIGENLNGQAAFSKEIMIINDIPENYITIESGLGKGKPNNLIIFPVIAEDVCIAVFEIATFKTNTTHIKDLLSKLTIPVSEKLLQMQKS